MRLPSDATLLVVDAGAAAAPAASPGPPADAAARIRILVEVWRSVGLPVMLVDGEGGGTETRLDGTRRISRLAASAFVGTDLDELLTARGCTTLVVCGFGTDAGIEATVRHAADLGFRLFVVGDACTTDDGMDLAGRPWAAADLHALASTRMARAGAGIVDWRTAWIAAKSAGWGRK